MPKSPEQNKAIQEKRRQDMKEKALRLFAIQGFDNVSVDDICKASKCAHGLFYHYYESREELFNDVLKDMDEKLLPLKEAKAEAGFSGLKLLLVQITNTLQEKPSSKTAFMLVHLTFQDQEDLQKAIYKKRFSFYPIAKDKIKEAQKEGKLIGGDPDEILTALVELLQSQLTIKLMNKKRGYKYLSEDVLESMLRKSINF